MTFRLMFAVETIPQRTGVSSGTRALLLHQLPVANRLRHVLRLLAVPRAVLELDRGIRGLTCSFDDGCASLPARPRAFDDLVVDALLVERLLHFPARMSVGLRPQARATVELDRHDGLLRVEISTIAQVATIGVGMLGYAFMGKAHSNAFKKISYITWPPPLEPKLVGIAGRNAEAVQEAADRYGYEYATDDWRKLVEDDSIGLFDNGGPNSLHAEPTIAAAQAGKHVVCEKPLGRDGAESYDIWQAVAATGVKHLCAFNYRFVPAI